MMHQWVAVLVTLATVVTGAMGQQEACNTKLTCSDCYTTLGCVFCGAKQLNTTLNRCVSQKNIPEVWDSQCPPEHRYMAVSNLTLIDSTETGGRKIRISPSKLELEIGQGQSHNVTIDVTVFDNPAVELYFVMDLSRSMWDDKETLYDIMQELIAELQKMTLDPPKIGFGAFVDKPVLPYISLAGNSKDSKSCNNVICDEPWGFRNYKKLTEDAEEVKNAIKKAPVAVNKDPLEGGFDGVMQAIVCDDVMGWSAGTEKMLVYLSDASPHLAGDGGLAGIMVPNDMECHMKEELSKNYTHVYSHSSIMDYPSVGQITQKAEEHGISIIFLSNKEEIPLYSRISQIIKDSSYAAITNDSSNIVDLITKEYEKIQQKLSLKDNSNSDAMSLRYFSKCKGDTLRETKSCSKLQKKDSVEFIVEVTMNNCEDFQEGHNKVINIWSFGDEKNPLELTINPLCKCSCEEKEHPDYDSGSPDCSYQGDMMCGVCQCEPGYGGKICDCSDMTDGDGVSSGCRPGNSTVECFDRGTCECNECQCEEGYSGDYCECDNLNCRRGLGQVCSGNGRCECGICICNKGWTGEACGCSEDTYNCNNPATGLECSANGWCECNQCICNNTVHSYTGIWCETCKDCPKRCDELGPCALCYHDAQGDETQCDDSCSHFQLQFTFLDHLDEPSEGDVLCSIYDSEECRVSFVYGPGEEGKLHLQVLEKKVCPIPVPILPIVLGIIGAIVVLGLIALLAWKCYANYQDKLEYEKFRMEQANAKWSEETNPMYKPATTHIQNPLFGVKD